MIDEGEGAPAFDLPAVVDGEIEHVALADYRGSDVVILTFYPADFNPACGGNRTDLDELDLFTMQKDVSILAVSGDSVYSHRAFADAFDLHIPLLSDTAGEVADAYGVGVDDPDAGHHTKRAVVVIAPDGDVEYAWSTDDLRELPPVERVREAVDDVGGSETAVARYRVGHAHYVEGRRNFTSGMGNFGDEEWMIAQNDFERAFDEFEAAADRFNTAVRFGVDGTDVAHFERAEDKAELLWQAAEWLAESAVAFASGEGASGEAMRRDAEAPLEEARRYGEPTEPDDFPTEEPPPPLAEVEGDSETFLADGEEKVDASLDVDIDEGAYADEDVRESVEGQGVGGGSAGAEGGAVPEGGGSGESVASSADPETPDDQPFGAHPDSGGRQDGVAGDGSEAAGADGDDDDDAIDEAELEEITAELEEQTEAARAEREEGADADEGDRADVSAVEDGETVDAGRAGSDDGGATASDDGGVTAEDGDGSDEDLELDLTDPTDGEGVTPLEDEEEEGDEEFDDGDHGVPDSL